MDLLPSAASIRARLAEADERLADPTIFGDSRKAAAAAREHQRLSRLLAHLEEVASLEEQARDARQLAADSAEDEEIRAMAEAELPGLEERLATLREEALLLLVPADPSDSRDTIMEIRAGTGGDEAALFAADLHRMYTRYAERQGWRCEPISASPSEGGGFKEVIFSIAGEDAYRRLKYESGVHRVQRVPVTEAGGRIHTSTATVAVLPEAEEVDVELRPEELEITVSRASGPGGQSVNTTDSAVQILHKPTGMIVHCADERSQLKNRTKAMTVLRSRLLQRKEEEEREKYAAHRRSQVGSGDRSERIRTYNFPQTRLTDHRINRTTHDLPAVMEGDLDELIDALLRADLRERAEAAVAAETGTADSPGAAS